MTFMIQEVSTRKENDTLDISEYKPIIFFLSSLKKINQTQAYAASTKFQAIQMYADLDPRG